MPFRILLGAFIFLLCCAAIAQTPNPNPTAAQTQKATPTPTLTPTPTPAYVSNIAVTKDAANIVFFAITAVLAILTYLQARRTIFTPFRTEAFKLQLKAFEDVLVFFEKHPTMSIDDEFDLDAIVHINALRLLDEYASHFFHEQIDQQALEKARKPITDQVAGFIASKDFFEKHFELPTHLKPEKQEAPDHPTNPAIILARWQEYQHGVIEYTKRFQESSERLRRYKVSPLLPRELKDHIEAFEKIVGANLSAVGETMTEIAKDLPQKYPTVESLKKSDLTWIWNQYNDKRTLLVDSQNRVLRFLSDYLQIDTLLPRKA